MDDFIMQTISYSRASKYSFEPLSSLLIKALLLVFWGSSIEEAHRSTGIPNRTIRRYYCRWKLKLCFDFGFDLSDSSGQFDCVLPFRSLDEPNDSEAKEFRLFWTNGIDIDEEMSNWKLNY